MYHPITPVLLRHQVSNFHLEISYRRRFKIEHRTGATNNALFQYTRVRVSTNPNGQVIELPWERLMSIPFLDYENPLVL